MRRFFLVLIPLLLVFSCKKQVTTPQITPSASTRDAKYYTNLFAYNTMNPYYLWRDTMVAELEDWNYTLDPVEKVASLRYKEGGTLVDRWTQLMEDYTPFQSSVSGNGKSFGMDFVLLRVKDSQDVVMEITFTYADSPARKAGLKRGDVVRTVDGVTLNMSNYAEVLNNKIYYFPETIRLGLVDDSTVTMTAVPTFRCATSSKFAISLWNTTCSVLKYVPSCSTINPNDFESRMLRTQPPTATFRSMYFSVSLKSSFTVISFCMSSLPSLCRSAGRKYHIPHPAGLKPGFFVLLRNLSVNYSEYAPKSPQKYPRSRGDIKPVLPGYRFSCTQQSGIPIFWNSCTRRNKFQL